MEPLVVHPPALFSQKYPDTPIAESRIPPRMMPHLRHQSPFRLILDRIVTRHRTVLPDDAARSTLRHLETPHEVIDCATPLRRAQNSPLATSLSISTSSVKSATARFSRPFSS